MNINELLNELSNFQGGNAIPSWKMEHTLSYKNDYITVIRLDSSNKWLGEPHASPMSKMWSIVFLMNKDFSTLPNYLELKKKIQIKITPVNSGKNKGCYGIRLYGMNQDPTPQIAKSILDFIFQLNL